MMKLRNGQAACPGEKNASMKPRQRFRIAGATLLMSGIALMPAGSALPLLSCSSKVVNYSNKGQDTVTPSVACTYNSDLGPSSARQKVWKRYDRETLVREISRFDLPIRAVTDSSGKVTGLPVEYGKYTVYAFGDYYVLAGLRDDRIVLAKEATGGVLNVGESIAADSLKFRLDSVGVQGNAPFAVLSALDANDTVLKSYTMQASETRVDSIGARTYPLHVYRIGPGDLSGAKWAEVAVYSTLKSMNEPGHFGEYDLLDSSYSFKMEWSANKQLQGWEMKRIQ